jgi:hypothetical protein
MMEDEEVPESEERKVPIFLYATYFLVFAWGVWAFFAYWNGSQGWLNRGYWKQLQEAAGTTVPFESEEPYLQGEAVLLDVKGNKDYND